MKSKDFLIAALSAITPKTGDVIATKRVENPIAKLHIELAVKLNDHIEVLVPSEFWNKATKYTGSIATDMLVAKPEFAQSYIYQPSNDFLFWGVKSFKWGFKKERNEFKEGIREGGYLQDLCR